MKKLKLPEDKTDVEAAQELVDIGMPGVEPVLGEILEWLQDYNWPVARVFQPLFDGIGVEVVPHIREVFSGDDEVWKYWLLEVVMPVVSEPAQTALVRDIERIATNPSDGEIREEVVTSAVDYLKSFNSNHS